MVVEVEYCLLLDAITGIAEGNGGAFSLFHAGPGFRKLPALFDRLLRVKASCTDFEILESRFLVEGLESTGSPSVAGNGILEDVNLEDDEVFGIRERDLIVVAVVGREGDDEVDVGDEAAGDFKGILERNDWRESDLTSGVLSRAE